MRRRWACPALATAALLAASSAAVEASASAEHHGKALFWSSGVRPELDRDFAELRGVASVSSDDVWAVGESLVKHEIATLIQHWDGSSWRVVPSPNPVGAQESYLNSVDAVSANNVWAVGEFRRGAGTLRTLVEHWNGTSWRRVPSPSPSVTQFGSRLNSVSAVSADTVWAAGYYDPPGRQSVHTLVMRWSGGSWSVIRSPVRPGVDRGFFGVSASNPSNGWAVGATIDRQGSRAKSLVEHWNGERWNQASIASPGRDYYVLYSVSQVAPGNAWAVGEVQGRLGPRLLVEHLSAGRWLRVSPPGLGVIGGLTSVSGDGPNDVWMVGWLVDGTVLEHWDGHLWTRFRGPGATTSTLQSVAAHGTTATWAVGTQQRKSAVVPFEERWNGHVWTR